MSQKNRLYVMRDSNYQKGLEDLIKYVNNFSETREMFLVEIGSYAGESTVTFADNFKKIIAIDPFLNDYDVNDITCQHMDLDKVYDVFKNRTSKYDNITLIRKTSDDAIEELKDIKIDFLYIDGLHTYDQVKKDINNYKNLIKETGFIAGHDYHPVWQGVVDAINEELGIPDMTFQDTSWIKKISNLQ